MSGKDLWQDFLEVRASSYEPGWPGWLGYRDEIGVCSYVYIIDQARSQDGWILAEFSLCVFMDRDEVEVYKNVKRERGQYPAILTELAWSIKDLLYGI